MIHTGVADHGKLPLIPAGNQVWRNEGFDKPLDWQLGRSLNIQPSGYARSSQ